MSSKARELEKRDPEEEEEEGEEEEEEQEEEEDWNELVALDEIEEMEDGPSTYFIGGFSVSNSLNEVLSTLQYQQDEILIFPGVYDKDSEVVLEESRLTSTHIKGVPFARGVQDGYPTPRAEKAVAKQGRRLGPWFSYVAAMTQSEEESKGLAVASKDPATVSSLLFGKTITPTQFEPTLFPIITAKLTFRYTYDESTRERDPDSYAPLKLYVPEEEEGEDAAEEGTRAADRNEDDDEEAEGNTKTPSIPVFVEGLCLPGGVVCDPLTRGQLSHCVIGNPCTISANPKIPTSVSIPTTITSQTLTEVVISRCLIYGGSSHAVYAFPESTLTLRGCIVDGAASSTVLQRYKDTQRANRHLSSGLALLEHRARQRAAAENLQRTNPDSLPTQDLEKMMSNFVVPKETFCQVGVYCDDSKISVQDCMISNVKIGVLLHDKCEGNKLTSCDIRSVEQVGVFVNGVGSSAVVAQTSMCACGRECLLVMGPTPAELESAKQQLEKEKKDGLTATKKQSQEDSEEEDGDGISSNFSQHPSVSRCAIHGDIRLQGDVRCGAFSDNIIYVPKGSKVPGADYLTKELSKTNAADNAKWAVKGFTFVQR